MDQTSRTIRSSRVRRRWATRRRGLPRWRAGLSKLLVGSALLVTAAVVPVTGAPSAHANPSSLFDMTQWTVLSQSAVSRWNDGTGFQYGTYSVATTWQGKSTTPLLVPSVGDVFYVHIYTEVYNVWQASYQMKVLLPAGLQLATITPSTDVFCGVTNFSNVSTRIMPECADPTVFGGYVVFPTVASGINERLHFFFPVVATQPINGGTMQVLSVQSNSPAVSLPNPTLTEHTIYVLAATSTATTPAAPTSLVATPGNGSATISFTAGSNGGSIISNYQYTLNNGVSWNTLSPADGLSPVTIPGLVNGTSYSIRLRAVNSVGAGAASAAVTVTPRTTPAAPTALVATPGNGSATISFTAGSNGGSAITNLQYSVDDGVTWTAFSPADTTSPVTIGGLANGTMYKVKLRAVSAVGVGAPSLAVGVTPAPVVPAAPAALSATPGNGSATISFTPASNGGSAVTNHQYSLNGGAWVALSPADGASPVTIKGLTNGTTYGIRLRAVNGVGAGAASAPVSVTPAPVPPAAPTRLVASPRNAAASIAFVPGGNGGAAITNYQYSVNNGAWKSLSPADAVSPVRIPGLANGVLYSVRLRALNAKGAGAASAAVAVRPSATPAVPGAPQSVSVKPGATGTTATVTFWPGSDGGAAITNYQYSLNSGAWKALSPADAASPVTITGLTRGAAYSIRIRAVNAKGAGAASASVSTRMLNVPAAPAGVVADGVQVPYLDPITLVLRVEYHARAAWAAPASNGSAITSYTVRWWSAPSGGTVLLSCSTAALTCNSTAAAYLFTNFYVDVVATNALGNSPPSARVLWHL